MKAECDDDPKFGLNASYPCMCFFCTTTFRVQQLCIYALIETYIAAIMQMKVDTTELVRPERFSLSQIKVYKDSKFEEDSEFSNNLKA